MNKFTRGPWNATEFNPVTGDIDDCYLYVEPGIAVIERKVKGRDQHDTANARLLAAAPDLLEALEAWIIYNDDGEDGVDSMLRYAKAIDMTRAAIAKARGSE